MLLCSAQLAPDISLLQDDFYFSPPENYVKPSLQVLAQFVFKHLQHLQRQDLLHVAFKLLLDFVEAGGEGSKERAAFERQLIEDLARASGLKATCFEVEKVEKGSIIAHILIHQDESGDGPGKNTEM